jgi:hypothetical protein
MDFLIDENLPNSVAEKLRDLGFGAKNGPGTGYEWVF